MGIIIIIMMMTVRGGGANIYYTSWVPSSTISPHYYYQPANGWILDTQQQGAEHHLEIITVGEEATVCGMDESGDGTEVVAP